MLNNPAALQLPAKAQAAGFWTFTLFFVFDPNADMFVARLFIKPAAVASHAEIFYRE
jgi:hypothetical protein